MTISTTTHDAAAETRNNWLYMGGGGVFLVALQFGNPQLVLPWMSSERGVSPVLIALFVPAVQVGQVFSLLMLGPMLARLRVKKWLLATSVLGLGLVIALAALASAALAPELAGVAIMACAAGYGVALGLYIVAHQDIIAKSIAPERRGTLIARRAAFGGFLTMAATAALQFWAPERARDYDLLLWMAVALWIVGSLAYFGVRELPEAVGERRPILVELRRGFALVRRHLWFEEFLVGRTLFLTIELAIPFYAIYVATLDDPSASNITVLIFAVSLGLLLGGPIWGRLQHRHCHLVMSLGAWLMAIAGLITLVIDQMVQVHIPYFHAGIFTLLALARQGIIQGRVYYLSTHTPEDDRAIYISISDAMMGALGVCIALALGWAVQLTNIFNPLLGLIALNMTAAVFASQVFGRRSNAMNGSTASPSV